MTPTSPPTRPIATFTGVGLGALGALVALVLSLEPLEPGDRPLVPFALAALPALAGLWIDWARLWQPSSRARMGSLALLALVSITALALALLVSEPGAALWGAVLLPLGLAAMVQLGAGALLTVAQRGRALFGFSRIGGIVRRDETHRVVLDTADGVVELDRCASDLGARRTVDLSIGASVTALARLRACGDADPYRAERRWKARTVLGVAATSAELAQRVRQRARAWSVYLVVLACSAGLLAYALAYTVDVDAFPYDVMLRSL